MNSREVRIKGRVKVTETVTSAGGAGAESQVASTSNGTNNGEVVNEDEDDENDKWWFIMDDIRNRFRDTGHKTALTKQQIYEVMNIGAEYQTIIIKCMTRKLETIEQQRVQRLLMPPPTTTKGLREIMAEQIQRRKSSKAIPTLEKLKEQHQVGRQQQQRTQQQQARGRSRSSQRKETFAVIVKGDGGDRSR